MSESSRYDDHRQRHGFKNTNPEFRDPSAWERLRFVATRTWGTTFHPRTSPLAPAANDGALLRDNDTAATITWIGHATFLIQLDGLNILTDPHWSERASPVGFAGPKRLVAPGLRFEDLPRIHLVLISHDHYDHLDIQTVWRVAQAHRPLFLVPLGLKRWFGDRQIQNVEEFDWWESRKFEDGVMTCVPAQHFSGRTLWDHNRRLWSGWSVQGRRQHFFFAGDTGYYRDLFTEMTRRLNPIDLAAIPIGAYLPPSMMQFVHSTPEQALQIFSDLHADRFVAMHWGTFDLADEPVGEPPERLHAERQRLGLNEKRIWIMSPGETRPW
ncbi:MAG TPA: MBL fold metallo-hydrolase [Nitrospiraceae bacterium]|nr:MBL fold metallo-hydrolase [Nitrospiraceae bacterium]